MKSKTEKEESKVQKFINHILLKKKKIQLLDSGAVELFRNRCVKKVEQKVTKENGRISAGENTRQPKNYYKAKKVTFKVLLKRIHIWKVGGNHYINVVATLIILRKKENQYIQ